MCESYLDMLEESDSSRVGHASSKTPAWFDREHSGRFNCFVKSQVEFWLGPRGSGV